MRRIIDPRVAMLALLLIAGVLGLTHRTNSWAAGMPMSMSAMPPRPTNAEAAFIASVSSALRATVPTVSRALAAGYYRTTRLEPDGTIIYFNNSWQPTRSRPNFLWYDKRDRLVGLDYQYLMRDYPRPPGRNVYPVAAVRWTTIQAHIHFAYRLPNGTIVRRGYRWLAGTAGGRVTATQLRAAKLLPPNATLLWTYAHPKSWDLGFWLVPNPNGAFADDNPNVRP